MKKIKNKNFVIKLFENVLVVGYIFFEELIWNVFAKPIFQYFKSLDLLKSLKGRFLSMDRYLLLTVFITILFITEVLGLLAGYFFINGSVFIGMLVYMSKIPIAAFTFWLFDLTKTTLMTFNWLETSYNYIIGWVEIFTHSTIYLYIKEKTIAVRSKIKRLTWQYLFEQVFIASIKAHYYILKSRFINFIKK